MSCRGALKEQRAGCPPLTFEGCRSLSEMVDVFLKARGTDHQLESAWWGDPALPFKKACRRAAFSYGNEDLRDGHQWVFTKAQLVEFASKLAAAEKRLSVPNQSFTSLYREVEGALGLRPKRKPLLVYDLTRRLGYRFGVEPDEVYLHAGVRTGAEALRKGLGKGRHRSLSDFPTSIRERLTPAQAEDFLCLAAPHLSPGLWD